MWTETLHTDFNLETAEWYGAGTVNVEPYTSNQRFYWSSSDDIDIVDLYGINDCNEIPKEDLHLFPACNACVTLNYAGFTEGWRLPSQRLADYDIKSGLGCDENCAYSTEGQYCAPGRQLWDFGLENCSNWAVTSCTSSQDSCYPYWDRGASASGYWSSTWRSSKYAWHVYFKSACVIGNIRLTYGYFVRCFLGEWP